MRGRAGRVDPRLIALAAIAVFAVLVYAAFTKGIPFSHGYRVDAVVSSSNGLREGAPVRIAGVSVGKVVGFAPGPGTTRIVTVEIEDRGRPLYRDATFEIRPRLFLEGGFYVQIAPGTPGAPELAEGGTIPLTQTSRPVGLDEVFGALRRGTRDGARRTLRELDRALGRGGASALREVPRPLAPALRDFALLAEAARGTEAHDLSGTVRASSRITSALASRDVQLSRLVTDLSVATGALAAEGDSLALSMRELAAVLREAPPQLDLLDRALPSLTRLSSALRPSLRIAPPVLSAATGLLEQVRAASQPGELPRLLSLLRPSLRRLPSLERRLIGLFPNVTQVTECVRRRVVPVLEADVDDGNLSTGRPIWQELLQALAGSASASQTFDGNGPWLRLLGLGGEHSVSLGDDLPGPEELLGRTSEPIVGTRPQPLSPGTHPALRPDRKCVDQPATDLRAGVGPPPQAGPSSAASRSRSLETDPRMRRLLRRLGAREER